MRAREETFSQSPVDEEEREGAHLALDTPHPQARPSQLHPRPPGGRAYSTTPPAALQVPLSDDPPPRILLLLLISLDPSCLMAAQLRL